MSIDHRLLRCTVAALLFALSATAGAATPPPVAAVRDTAETMHGVTVHDPYRYFENTKDPEVQAWLRAQSAYAREQLDRLPTRAEFERRIAEIADAAGDSVRAIVRMPGERIFYLKRGRDEKQFKLVMRKGLAGDEQLLFDPEVESKRTGVPQAINYFVPSWDGRYVAYGVSAGGSEDASLHIMEVATGSPVGAPIKRVSQGLVSWLPDSKSFTYNQLRPLSPEDAATETYLDSRVMWLKLGEPEYDARPVFGPTVTRELGLQRLDVGGILFAPGSHWMVARTTDTTLPEGSLFIAQVSDLSKSRIPWKKIAGFDDRIVDIALKGHELFYRTRHQAPRYRLMKLDLRQPQIARAVEIGVAPSGGVIEGFVLGRDSVVASVRHGTEIGLRRYASGDRAGRAIRLPFAGAARAQPDPAHAYADLLYTLSGWTRWPQVMQLRGDQSTEAALVPRVAPPRLPEIEVTSVKVPSHDGALVPMTILHRKGLKRDGSNPTLLNGYGAYGFSETAGFSPANLAWLEQGGVIALANVRGSGVYGEPWRLAGFKATKANTWKDGIACAQFLIREGYASPATLGIMGTSAGGIFVGRSVTSAPQLFAAAIFNVGVMDAVRAEESANGITNISEFGSAHSAQEFPAVLEMSTYHQIRDGTPYPAVMLVHGMNDPRVDVWHSAKAAARLQAATSSGKPILLRLDAQAGHGVGSTAPQRYAQAADIFSFLLWQMGKTRPAE